MRTAPDRRRPSPGLAKPPTARGQGRGGVGRLHLPHGTSEWNKIEYSLRSFISMNWTEQLLASHRVIVVLIGETTTTSGFTVHCELDSSTANPVATSTGRGSVSPTRKWKTSIAPAVRSTESGTTPSTPPKHPSARLTPDDFLEHHRSSRIGLVLPKPLNRQHYPLTLFYCGRIVL